MIFDFGHLDRVLLSFWLRAGRSPADFRKVAMAPAKAMKATTLTASNVYKSVAETVGLKPKEVKGAVEALMGVASGRIKKVRFVQACWHARVEVEEEACNARAQRREPIHQGTLRLQSKARVQDGPRSRNEEVKRCSELTLDSCWLNRRQIDLNLGGWSHQV